MDLFNYPCFLRELQIPGHSSKIDLAAADIFRDRERKVPRYNAFRRQMGLSPITTFTELTNEPSILKDLIHVYDNDVEKIDLLVGTHLEEKMPKCIFGETIYSVFVLQTIRRTYNDRFFTIDFDEQHYTKIGIQYVQDITFKDIFERHFPVLKGHIPQNPFLLWT